MKPFLILLLAGMTGCASVPKEAKEADPHIFTLSDEQLRHCGEEHGCVVISRDKAMEMLKEVHDDALQSCGSRT